MKPHRDQVYARLSSSVVLGVVSLSSAAAQPFIDANWTSLASTQGANGFVRAAAVDGLGNLYIGGSFTVVDGVNAGRVAKWNGSSWSALGSGMNNTVYALAVSDTNLYVGGLFTTAGGGAANLIARWDGSNWSPLPKEVNSGGGAIYALAVSGSDLYAGGQFGLPPFPGGGGTFVAKWDGTNWHQLGLGTSDVRALVVSGSNLYAGGGFTLVGGVPANNIAKLNGTNWASLGSGMNTPVSALAVWGGEIYAGGAFTAAGGAPASYIAKWDGTDWTTPASGMNDAVWTLTASGSYLYAGGRFTNASGSAANYIARWDGSNWSPLGSGMDQQVYALAVSGSDLYAGGRFTTAGGKPTPYVARAYLLTLPTLSVFSYGSEVSLSWPSTETTGFILELSDNLSTAASWVTNTANLTDDGTNRTVIHPATNGARFFRLRRP